MTPGGGDFQNAAGRFLSAKVGEVRRLTCRRQQFGHRRRQMLDAAKMIEQRHQIRRGDNREFARPGRFRAAPRRADQVTAGRHRRHRRRQDTRHRLDGTMKRQFAKHHMPIDGITRNAADGDKKAKRDRQVEMRSFLDDIGRGKIDRDPLWWQC